VAARVGGDFYDVFEIDDRRLGIIMGDVSGKGLSAATLTSLVKDTIRAYAFDGASPALTMEKTNEVIVRSSEPSSFVTAFFGVLDRATGELVYSSAGHPPAILAQHGEHSRFLPSQSPVLGAFQGLLYREDRETLAPGDTLFLYTDGVTEAREGAAFFGEERLLGNLQGLNGASPRDVVHMVFADILTHTRGNLSDDMALFTVRLS
jgi:sigma-B regulation protein RsbU (phosphoserine phosphatase)